MTIISQVLAFTNFSHDFYAEICTLFMKQHNVYCILLGILYETGTYLIDEYLILEMLFIPTQVREYYYPYDWFDIVVQSE